ncbi:Deoxyuridine 5'-triphosphate nucleotidohydrolase-like 9 [Homarus americanus]|uniref:Deoxyuridine 5'-triphosphate nucleotidohydrolase n=1 Tax=Homarus americanus TaxID=6706 RepID=A0A8J5K062_HOMAM|nr:Deoxyuridine 5'-triphosphate nucleotidohydrolase-like 9 [Homarus americanus]
MPSTVRSVLRFKKLSGNALTPSKGSKLAAGFDLSSAYDIVIAGQGKALIKTDIQVELPEDCYGRVAPRSGLSWKNHIDVGAGVIDRDYRGNVGVVLFNHAKTDFEVKKGDRVAQLICEKIVYPDIEEVEDQFHRDLYAEATETNVEKFIGTADTADKLQENDKFADKQDFAEKFAEKFSQKFVDKFTEKKLEDMDEDKFADNTNKKYWNWRMLFQQPTLLFFLKCFSKQQQQKQQNKCEAWTFWMGYLMGYLFNSVLMSVIITIMIIARSVIKRRSITVNSIKQQQQQQQQQQQNERGGLWTFRDGYMVMGTLFLCVMLVIWVIMVIRRLINRRQDSSPPPPEMPPPSYFELDEMPPPSYFEQEIDDQNCCDYNSITSTLITPPLGTAV